MPQFAAAVLYAAVSELLLQPAEYLCFNKCLDRIKDDPRVTVRLGEPVHAYGTESRNRAARQHVPHRFYDDSEGRQHMQVSVFGGVCTVCDFKGSKALSLLVASSELWSILRH